MYRNGRYKSFLDDEFAANGFLENDPFNLRDQLIDEIAEVMLQGDFEGRYPPFGSLVLSDGFEEYGFDERKFDGILLPTGDCSLTPQYCDGTNSFRVSNNAASGVLALFEPVLTELDLFTLRDDVLYNVPGLGHGDAPQRELFAIKRDASGSLFILSREGMAIYRSSHFHYFSYQYEHKGRLNDFIAQTWGSDDPWPDDVLNSTLRVIFQRMRFLTGHGCTIVLLHPNDQERISSENDKIVSFRNAIKFGWDFRITRRHNQRILENMLLRRDGATILHPDGFVHSVQSWLLPEAQLVADSIVDEGSRHVTARAFSHEIDGLVFVVSASGPVSVFWKGQNVPLSGAFSG